MMSKNNTNNVYKQYNKIADWYDEHRNGDLFEKVWLDKATSLIQLNSKVLDLGCGTGTPMVPYFLEKGFTVIGVDGSKKLIDIAKLRYPKAEFIISDMRTLNINQKFDLVIAWNSFFHLSQNDQRTMFKNFLSYLNIGGALLFTSGPDSGEVWSDNGGENLYHASLSADEYKDLLMGYGFKLVEYKISDPDCFGSSVWLAQLQQ